MGVGSVGCEHERNNKPDNKTKANPARATPCRRGFFLKQENTKGSLKPDGSKALRKKRKTEWKETAFFYRPNPRSLKKDYGFPKKPEASNGSTYTKVSWLMGAFLQAFSVGLPSCPVADVTEFSQLQLRDSGGFSPHFLMKYT